MTPGAAARVDQPGLADAARDWMLDVALPAWARLGMTPAGRFHEGLRIDGTPAADIPRRTRTQARQIVVFRRAARLGWRGPADEIAALAFERLIDTCRGSHAGAWIETIGADDQPIDTHPDLYTHACVLLALAEVHAGGDRRAAPLALETLRFLDRELGDVLNGGWRERSPPRLPRRQNPHMHLLEAALAWMEVSEEAVFAVVAKQVLALFEARLLAGDLVREHFREDWTPDPEHGDLLEPGHHAEWICLLRQAEDRRLGDYAPVRDRLYGRLVRQLDRDGWAINCISSRGRSIDPRRRMWAQCETLRAHLVMGATGRAERLAEALFDTHLDAPTPGLWIDAFDARGRPLNGLVPGSSFYHLTSAFAALSESGI